MQNMKLITTIDSSLAVEYVSGWGFPEAFREFYANAEDAVVDGATIVKGKLWKSSGAPGVGTAVLETAGEALSRSSLMLGVTKKGEDNRKYIGRHGEGMKVAAGVLLRLGHDVEIHTGDEVWVPKIRRMEQYDWAEGVSWEIYKAKNRVNGVRVEISDVERGEFEVAISRCLSLFNGKGGIKKIDVPYHGAILLNKEHRGKLFSHGVYVCELSSISSGSPAYGYDLVDVPLSRDRDVPSRYDVAYSIKSIIADAVSSGSIKARHIYDAINPERSAGKKATPASEAGFLEDAYHSRGSFSKVMAAEFLRRNPGKIPAEAGTISAEDAYRLGAMGINYVEVTKALLKVIGPEFTSVSKTLEANDKQTVKRIVGPTRETAELHMFVHGAIRNRYKAGVMSSRVSLAELAEGIAALASGDDVFVSIDYWASSSYGSKISTLCHEFAHRYGGDSDPSHTRALEEMMGDILDHIVNQQQGCVDLDD